MSFHASFGGGEELLPLSHGLDQTCLLVDEGRGLAVSIAPNDGELLLQANDKVSP
jgi:hypothetical protein